MPSHQATEWTTGSAGYGLSTPLMRAMRPVLCGSLQLCPEKVHADFRTPSRARLQTSMELTP